MNRRAGAVMSAMTTSMYSLLGPRSPCGGDDVRDRVRVGVDVANQRRRNKYL